MKIVEKRSSFLQSKESLCCAILLMRAVPATSYAGEAELKAEIDKLWPKLANIEPAGGTAIAEEQGGKISGDQIYL